MQKVKLTWQLLTFGESEDGKDHCKHQHIFVGWHFQILKVRGYKCLQYSNQINGYMSIGY